MSSPRASSLVQMLESQLIVAAHLLGQDVIVIDIGRACVGLTTADDGKLDLVKLLAFDPRPLGQTLFCITEDFSFLHQEDEWHTVIPGGVLFVVKAANRAVR